VNDRRSGNEAIPPAPGAVNLILTDFDSESCGVGHTVGSWARTHLGAYRVIDPRRSWRAIAGEALTLRPPVILTYPTRNGRGSPKTLLLLAGLRLRREPVGVYLHEFLRAHPLHRLYMQILLWLTTGPVVVSSVSEAADVRPHLRRGRRLEVCPAPAGSLPMVAVMPSDEASGPDCPLVVGLFGIPRRNKGLDRFWDWLEKVAGDVPVEIRLVGSGWEEGWAPTDRFGDSVRLLGRVPTEALPEVFSGWDLALAPFEEGATDGRNSLRTPCAGGVPVVTVFPPDPADLTFRPPRGVHDLESVSSAGDVTLDIDGRTALARWTDAFDQAARRRLVELLVGQPSTSMSTEPFRRSEASG